MLEQNRYTEALPYLEKVVHLVPETSVMALNLANALRKTGRIEDAKAVIVQARKTWKDDPALAFEEGEIEYHNRNYKTAIMCYQVAMLSINRDRNGDGSW